LDALLLEVNWRRFLEHPCLDNLKLAMDDKDTPLYKSAAKGTTRYIKYYLSIDTKIQSEKLNDYLYATIRRGIIESVRAFLDAGADPEMGAGPKDLRRTALHLAANLGLIEIASLLIAHRAPIDACDIICWTPLHNAVFAGHIDTIICLIKHGASVTSQEGVFGMSPLHISASRGFLAAVDYLLNHGALIDFLDQDGRTAFHYAVRDGRFDTVTSLIQNGASIDTGDCSGRPASHYAVIYGSKEMVALIRAQNASIDIKDKCSRTPLHYAADQKDIHKVTYFLDREVPVDIHDSY
jgi:ankyrin repeat protein